MPNWCYNHVTITGTLLDLNKLSKKIVVEEGYDEVSLLKGCLPMPAEYAGIEGYNNGGYEWANSTWGTKWAEVRGEMSRNDFGDTGQIITTFDSPWCPPLEGYGKISEMFPELIFTHYWDEPGMCFCGITVTKAGETIMMEEIFDKDYPLVDWDEENAEDDFYELVNQIRDHLIMSANDAIKSLK